MSKAAGDPTLIPVDGKAQKLERVQLGAGLHDEQWLQQQIFEFPELLPIAQIEPGFGEPLPIAREVACGHGAIDNLYLTPSGEIIVVETKLWRNVQARREVFAQALDYVAALMKLGYEAFEQALLKTGLGLTARSLYARVGGHPEALPEPEFIDAVSRNLARGRMLVLVVGDGIRAEAQALAALLQSHAGAHFTFALVELGIWRSISTGDLLAVPNTLLQTAMVERGILRFEGPAPTVEAVRVAADEQAKTITEEMFFEAVQKRHPQLPQAIRAFLQIVEPLGVYPGFLASLNLKADLPFHARPTNFGYITKHGKLWTGPLSWTTPQEVALHYNETLARLTGGQVATHDGIYLSTNGKAAPLVSALLPQHAREWADAIQAVIHEAHSAELARAL